MHAGEHSILERLAGDIVERWQDEKINRRDRLASDKVLQDRHHSGAIKTAPVERLARKPERRLDVVERDPVIRRRSIGRGLADEFGHSSFGPPIIRDFKLGREARERDSHEPMVAETEHLIRFYHTLHRSEVWARRLGPRRSSRLDDLFSDLHWRRHRVCLWSSRRMPRRRRIARLGRSIRKRMSSERLIGRSRRKPAVADRDRERRKWEGKRP